MEDMVAKRARPSQPAAGPADPQQVLVAVTTTPGLEDVITEEIHTTLPDSEIVRVYPGLGRLHLLAHMDDGKKVRVDCLIEMASVRSPADRGGCGAGAV